MAALAAFAGGRTRQAAAARPARGAVAAAVASALLALLWRQWRRWLLRRAARQALAAGPALAPAPAAAGRPARVAPPARPGADLDQRLGRVDDDPRYFAGAQLGKAQRAALGERLLAPGTNTVSFDPASTLVRPSMRVRHLSWRGGAAAGSGAVPEPLGALRPDDVVAVPGGLCEEGDYHLFGELRDAVRDGGGAGGAGREAVSLVCGRLGLAEAECRVSVRWLPAGAPPQGDLWPAAGAQGSREARACVTLGAACEHALWRAGADGGSEVRLSGRNGCVYLLGCDMGRAWRWEVQAAESALGGLIFIGISGPCSMAEDEAKLAPAPSTPPAALKEGTRVHDTHDSNRPCMRIITLEDHAQLRDLSHDDVIVIPNFFCDAGDWDLYYDLLRQAREDDTGKGSTSTWESWHEGSHLLTKRPEGSDAFRSVIDRICDAFHIANKDCRDGNSVGTRFNWYRDGADWKPFHHDSAAFNPQRAAKQNCTVGASFGASRELAFRHAKTGELIYFPQTNGMLFFFGRDVNIRWQHGINALPTEDQDGKGRVSIILWGLTLLAREEAGSPPMLEGSSGPSAKGGGRGGERCRAFLRGSCSYGAACRFLHVAGSAQAAAGSLRSDVCRNYQRLGSCAYGDGCRYAHHAAGGA